VKTSLVFLGSIVAATFCAHRFWPKGVTYGEREEWEIERVQAHIKRDLANEKRAGRRRRPASMVDPGARDARSRGGYAFDSEPERGPGRDRAVRGDMAEPKRHRSRDGRRRSYYAAEKEAESGSSFSSSRSGGTERDGSRERERDERDSPGRRREAERPGGRRRSMEDAEGDVRRRPSRRRNSYYPPPPQRYYIAPEGYRSRPPSVGSYQPRRQSGEGYRSRPVSVEGRRSQPYYAEIETEYVEAPPRRARRSSVDGGRPRSTSRDDYS